jgi:hypothetical protein
MFGSYEYGSTQENISLILALRPYFLDSEAFPL